MSASVDPKVIESTKELLGAVIKKPALTDKLLSRPPFKFLHDIIVNVVKSCNFFDDTFTPEELVSDNVSSKDAKVAFLQKCIDAVVSITGKPVDVKPGKVVAGMEAEKTNVFLQALALAASGKPGSGKPKQATVAKPVPKKPAAVAAPKVAKKASPKPAPAKETVVKEPSKKEPPTKEPTPPTKEPTPPKKSSPKEHTPKVTSAEKRPKKEEQKMVVEMETEPAVISLPKEPEPEIIKSPKLTVSPPKEKVAKKTRKVMEEADPPSQSMDRPKTAGRPKTARAAPPRIKVEVEEAPSADALATLAGGQSEVGSSRHGSAIPVAVITESGTRSDDEEEDAVKIQTDTESGMRSGRTSALGGEIDGTTDEFYGWDRNLLGRDGQVEEKGSLVQKLIETKRDFEGTGMESDGQMETSLDAINVEKIRANIQSLARLSVPVGRLFDYLHEDIDSMLNELRLWNEEVIKTASLKEQQAGKDREEEERLRKELEQLENEINDEMDKISVTKGNIERNDEKLRKMMINVVHR